MNNSFLQTSFKGGINLNDAEHSIRDDQYVEGHNVRNREVELSCIKAPTKDTQAPIGKKQGIYGFDKYLLLFNKGFAYYKDTESDDTSWHNLGGAVFDANVDRIYTQAVPASTLNYSRRLQSTSNIDTILTQSLVVNGTPAGLVIQDGYNQPRILTITNVTEARRIKTYQAWTTSDREYVPIGNNMAYMNGILFVVGKDRKTIYRSVSGRPLDFVINVKEDGTKGGDADTTSYAVGYDYITGIFPSSGEFLIVGTDKTSFPLELNYNQTIFGEPTFLNRRQFASGCINQFSIAELLNDYAWIDRHGVRSYNAISQLNNEGRNSIFSKNVDRLIAGVLQDPIYSAATVFNNYAFFATKTSLGFRVLVYDTINESWSSIDNYGCGAIKQFASVKRDSELWAITDTEVFHLFSSRTNLEARVKTRSHITGNAKIELQLQKVRTVFVDSDSEAIVSVTELSNGTVGKTVNRRVANNVTGVRYPVRYPVRFMEGDAVENLPFDFEGQASTSWKLGAEIKWNNGARLAMCQVDTKLISYDNPIKQQ